MASRAFNRTLDSLSKKLTSISAVIGFGGGSPTLVAWTPPQFGAPGEYNPANAALPGALGTFGVSTVTLVGTGDFLITLQNSYQRLLGITAVWLNSTGIPTAPDVGIKSTEGSAPDGGFLFSGIAGGGSTLEIVTSAAGSATAPADGDILFITLLIDDSTSV